MRVGGWLAALAATALVGGIAAHGIAAHGVDPVGPARFTSNGELIFPADYRNWTFLTAGHGMSYNAAANTAANLPFDNVFVDPGSHAAFLKTGHWPEGTMLIIDVRGSATNGSINRHGAFQSGASQAIEVHLHDSKRFKGGWGFFAFRGTVPATVIPMSADCYSCHLAHAAVDTTFVQFYPTLLPVATARHTAGRTRINARS